MILHKRKIPNNNDDDDILKKRILKDEYIIN